MTAASITGTTHGAAQSGRDGFVFRTPDDRCTIEVGGGGLTAVVTVTPGAAVEFAPCDNADVVTGSWVTRQPGESFALGPGDRRMGRMVGIGGAGVRVQFAGPQLETLRNYAGHKGTSSE
jgi:hypothetical protein